MNVIYTESAYLAHHGILGQKWGVRRYQNEDGTLTEEGRRRQQKLTASNKEASLVKGTKLYRVSGSNKGDESDDKIYVNATPEGGDFYAYRLGAGKIFEDGKAFIHEYTAKQEIKMPSKRTMEQIELGLLKDKDINREIVNSIMNKGLSREEAEKQAAPYSAGREFVNKLSVTGVTAALFAAYGSAIGFAGTANPLGAGIGAAAGGVAGAGLGLAATWENEDKKRALTTIRASYGDKNNKLLNEALKKQLADKGYNAVKDYNDRRAFGKNGNQAVIVFDSKNNIKNTSVKELNSEEFGKAYARNYMREHPNTKSSFDDLVKDGEKRYKTYYEEGVLERDRKRRKKEALEQAKQSKTKRNKVFEAA